jgi:hypothetical protein
MDDDEEDEKREGQTAGEDKEMMNEERAAEEREEKRRYRPYKFSGKTYTFDMGHEKVILDDLRNWSFNYFAKEYVITREMYKLLKDLKTYQTSGQESSSTSAVSGSGSSSNEFDLLVKILKVIDKDEHTLELRIKDTSQKMWFMTVPRLKFHPSVLR